MPFFGKYVEASAYSGLTFVPLAARGSGNSGQLDAPVAISFEVRVTVAGTTLAVQLEESDDGSSWANVGSAVNQNGVGTSARAQRTIQRRYMRFSWTITGANYTFAVEGDCKA